MPSEPYFNMLLPDIPLRVLNEYIRQGYENSPYIKVINSEILVVAYGFERKWKMRFQVWGVTKMYSTPIDNDRGCIALLRPWALAKGVLHTINFKVKEEL